VGFVYNIYNTRIVSVFLENIHGFEIKIRVQRERA